MDACPARPPQHDPSGGLCHAGVGQATINDILNQGHIPRCEVLFRLADYFGTSHAEILQIAGLLQSVDKLPGAETGGSDEHPLTWQLVEEFRQAPDEWKHEAVGLMKMFLRLAKLPQGNRVTGGEPSGA